MVIIIIIYIIEFIIVINNLIYLILGIKEKSILFELQSIKFPKSFPIDIMHLFFENVASHMFKLWPYKKLKYVFYTFCICFVYVFKKSTVFIRNWLIFRINYTFLILRFLYVFKNLIKNVELKMYNLYGILTNSL